MKALDKIPESALYPKNDELKQLCDNIKNKLKFDNSPTRTIGDFLRQWSKIENLIITDAQQYKSNVYNFRKAIFLLMESEKSNYGLLKELDHIRKFRNKLVHDPMSISEKDLESNLNILDRLYEEISYNK